MSEYRTQIKRVVDDCWIDALLHTELTVNELFDAEESWAPVRVRLMQKLLLARADDAGIPQSLHWDWAIKAQRLSAEEIGPLGRLRLFGMIADGKWQGMLLATTLGHPTRLVPVGFDQVYVEFAETAPWNWEVTTIQQTGQFRGVGMQLIRAAVLWSRAEGFGGRLALHSLPQAEDFYRSRCGMTDLGVHSTYQGLRYFEMTESQAKSFLGESSP
jgi:GNAT superfamily N-acetyltransferase